MSREPVKLVGGTGSPYTQKMIACCATVAFPMPSPGVSPRQCVKQWGSRRPSLPSCPPSSSKMAAMSAAHCDSTPIIRRLEAEHDGRSVLPEDPGACIY